MKLLSRKNSRGRGTSISQGSMRQHYKDFFMLDNHVRDRTWRGKTKLGRDYEGLGYHASVGR